MSQGEQTTSAETETRLAEITDHGSGSVAEIARLISSLHERLPKEYLPEKDQADIVLSVLNYMQFLQTKSGMDAHQRQLETAKAESAAEILIQAVVMEKSHRYLQATADYRKGLGILLGVLKDATSVDVEKEEWEQLYDSVDAYLSRLKQLEKRIEDQKRDGRFRESFQIADNEIGQSYNRVFSPLLDDKITHVIVEDPKIRSHEQVLNFIDFCDLMAKSASNLETITLMTVKDDSGIQPQAFKQLAENFAASKDWLTNDSSSILLKIVYSSKCDRKITFGNGYVVKINRGLDYFKYVSEFSLGFDEKDLCPCHETNVEITYQKIERKGEQKPQILASGRCSTNENDEPMEKRTKCDSVPA